MRFKNGEKSNTLSQLLRQSRKASCECLLSITHRKKTRFTKETRCQEICCVVLGRETSEGPNAIEAKFLPDKRRADRRRERDALRQHEFERQQLPAPELVVGMKMSAVREDQRRGILDEAAHELNTQERKPYEYRTKIWHINTGKI